MYAPCPRRSSCHSPALRKSYLRSQQTRALQLLPPPKPSLWRPNLLGHCIINPLTALVEYGPTEPKCHTHPLIKLLFVIPAFPHAYLSPPIRFRTEVWPRLGVRLTLPKWRIWCGLRSTGAMGRGTCVRSWWEDCWSWIRRCGVLGSSVQPRSKRNCMGSRIGRELHTPRKGFICSNQALF